MILVTGGTGLVGSHLLYNLISQNKKVRALYRRKHKIDLVKHVFSYYSGEHEALFNAIEWVEGDLNDVPALEKAFENVTHVYHAAAFVSFEPDKYRQLRKINIEGTANIVNLCIAHKIQKLCYVSSVAAVGHTQQLDDLITEETSWNKEEDHSVYAITKYGAEIEVWRGTQEGVDTVIVNPGVILGPGYWRSGGSGSLITKIYKGMLYYTQGVAGYVDIWDVTQAMTQLMDSDIKNERFILVSENLSFRDFQTKVANALNVAPAKKEATKLILEIGWRLDWLNHKLRGKRRKLSKQLAKTVNSKRFFDNSKVKSALSFEFARIDESITKVGGYFLKDLE
ncbi:nucleoside-diphosphate-sugar epimerase [Flavobacteriaceae bacterium MAR_2010_72]|nr:nucleoside-diphosphate-sugar epimerase [Flavobacteriaceae bacterium MAR_2010_72]TVZ58020.1 nucleoside-diphosphate-sugar epimerase [Flavobacteriaceae bacterium MAR_2010_105]